MADQVDKNINENYTTFGTPQGANNGYYLPSGPIGKFFAKFFTTKGAKHLDNKEGEVDPAKGDTVINTDVLKVKRKNNDSAPAVGGIQVTPIMPQLELNRKRRYREYEEMDQYPEIGASFDIYADDATQRGLRGERWSILSKEASVVDEVEDLFSRISLHRLIWDIIRNVVKYGDCFTELVLDVKNPDEGIKKIKILNPSYLLRVEDEFGYLQKFMQEIPNLEVMNYGTTYDNQQQVKYIDLDKNQIVHFRLHTSDPTFYPYGKSVAALCHRTFRSLKMMEDAMLIYRITRAPERRIFYVDVGNLPTSKAEMFIERMKSAFKKEKFYNPQNGSVDARHNPLSMDEDYFVATKNGKGTKIDTLPGAQNLGEIEDVRYFRDKLLASLKIPKDYIVEKDKSPERKANLSQLDAKFARVILRLQTNIEVGLENIAKRHLQLRGFPASLIRNLEIRLPDPSDISVKRKLEIDEQKTRVIQAVQGLGLLPKKHLYREYFDMTDDQIDQLMAEMEQEQQKDAQKEQARMDMGLAGNEQGGQPGESPEQPAPGAAQPMPESLEPLRSRIPTDDMPVFDRIVEKQKAKQLINDDK